VANKQTTPYDKTIANFRSDNAVALKQMFRAFALMLNNAGLYGKETETTDNTKFSHQQRPKKQPQPHHTRRKNSQH
jgi:hypothetical protein